MRIMDNTAERTLSIHKTFDAPIETVWAAWTNVEKIIKWWAPNGMQVNSIKHDFKVGGQWCYTMDLPDGNTFTSEGTYSEIVVNERITTSADFKPMTVGVVLQLFFKEDEMGTEIVLSVLHPTAAYCGKQENMGFYKGWEATLERLETFLAE